MSARRVAAGVVLALGVAALGVVAQLARSRGGTWSAARALWLVRGTGWTAVGALALSLSATPVGRLLGRLQPPERVRRAPSVAAFRRAFGIAAAVLALLHAASVMRGYLLWDWAALLAFSYLRVGVVALVMLCVLLASSFAPVVRGLRVRLWKPLHRLAYGVALLVLEHLLLAPFAPRAVTLALFAVVLAFGLLRLLSGEAAVEDG